MLLNSVDPTAQVEFFNLNLVVCAELNFTLRKKD